MYFSFRHPGPTKKPHAEEDLARHMGIEVQNVGGWLTHGDSAVETDCDFLFITETRLIPARSRNEALQLDSKIWPLFGLLSARLPLMLVRLVLGW